MSDMAPRPLSENTFQVAFKIPEDWIKVADAVAASMSRPGVSVTRTDALRAALHDGLRSLQDANFSMAHAVLGAVEDDELRSRRARTKAAAPRLPDPIETLTKQPAKKRTR